MLRTAKGQRIKWGCSIMERYKKSTIKLNANLSYNSINNQLIFIIFFYR